MNERESFGAISVLNSAADNIKRAKKGKNCPLGIANGNANKGAASNRDRSKQNDGKSSILRTNGYEHDKATELLRQIESVTVCHRGFSIAARSPYRG